MVFSLFVRHSWGEKYWSQILVNPNPFAHAVSRVLWHGAAIKKGQKSDVLDPVAWSSGKKAGYLGVIQGYDTSCVLQQNFLKRVSSEIAK